MSFSSSFIAPIRQPTYVHNYMYKNTIKHERLVEMWDNAQRDGSPSEYRWHPLFNATKFG